MRHKILLIIVLIMASTQLMASTGHNLWLLGQDYSDVMKSAKLRIDGEMGAESYRLIMSKSKLEIISGSDRGLMYGAFAYSRMKACGKLHTSFDIKSEPKYKYRILNHWDNFDGSVERGYAGNSIWGPVSSPIPKDRIREYAIACASVGINGIVINNVNDPNALRPEILQRVASIAEILRCYGIRTYLSVDFDSPKRIGGLVSFDPHETTVSQWWCDVVDSIYALIPDFGGFLIKLNSEGKVGPQVYGLDYSDGANMIASALKPHGGILMLRTFVHIPNSTDSVMDGCNEFNKTDGKYLDNVILQIKNGPLDFQPREPFNPLFSSIKHTAVMPELQITQEYLGFSNHLVFLAPLFKECLNARTYAKEGKDTIADRAVAISGVANVGDDENWCGHLFAQANWYAFGRLAWDTNLSSEEIAEEWVRQTFKKPQKISKKEFENEFLCPMVEIMIKSREIVVNYMCPLGLTHLMEGAHYAAGPWECSSHTRRDWQPVYYHRASADSIGFDRTRSGSSAVDQYEEPLASLYNNIETCPHEYLLWFHRLPWNYKMESGGTLWKELCESYEKGVAETEGIYDFWLFSKKFVDEEEWLHVRRKLEIQCSDAILWKDACLGYFQSFNKLQYPNTIKRSTVSFQLMKQMNRNINNYLKTYKTW